jgi:hypothetical protein
MRLKRVKKAENTVSVTGHDRPYTLTRGVPTHLSDSVKK